MEQLVNIITARLTMGMWPVTYLLQQYIRISYGVYKNSAEILPCGELNAIPLNIKMNWSRYYNITQR